jgi:hypothetical protein
MPGCKPILEPNKATGQAIRNRLAFLAMQRRMLRNARSEITNEIKELDAETDTLNDAHIIATGLYMETVPRSK